MSFYICCFLINKISSDFVNTFRKVSRIRIIPQISKPKSGGEIETEGLQLRTVKLTNLYSGGQSITSLLGYLLF